VLKQRACSLWCSCWSGSELLDQPLWLAPHQQQKGAAQQQPRWAAALLTAPAP
jgi:hypothetical protein